MNRTNMDLPKDFGSEIGPLELQSSEVQRSDIPDPEMINPLELEERGQHARVQAEHKASQIRVEIEQGELLQRLQQIFQRADRIGNRSDKEGLDGLNFNQRINKLPQFKVFRDKINLREYHLQTGIKSKHDNTNQGPLRDLGLAVSVYTGQAKRLLFPDSKKQFTYEPFRLDQARLAQYEQAVAALSAVEAEAFKDLPDTEALDKILVDWLTVRFRYCVDNIDRYGQEHGAKKDTDRTKGIAIPGTLEGIDGVNNQPYERRHRWLGGQIKEFKAPKVFEKIRDFERNFGSGSDREGSNFIAFFDI